MANISNEKSLLVMNEYKLDTELMFVTLFLVDVDDVINLDIDASLTVSKIKEYFNSGLNNRSFAECIVELKKRRIIEKPENPESLAAGVDKFNFLRLKLTGSFRKKYYAYGSEMGAELVEHYPKFGYINDKEIPLISVKKCSSDDELFYRYAKIIDFNIEQHKKIIGLIDWAKEYKTSFINMNIESFVFGRVWIAIEEFKLGGNEGFDISYKNYSKCI